MIAIIDVWAHMVIGDEVYQMTSSQKERMLIVRSHLNFVQQSIASLASKLDELIASYENAVSLLCTIPGVDRSSAITIISKIGTDMTQFNSSKRLCCWAGLTPGNNESAGKKKSVRITRTGVYLKPALVQCTHAAVKSTAAPYYKNKFERLAKRRGKKEIHYRHRKNDSDCCLPNDFNRRNMESLQFIQNRYAAGAAG